MNNINLVEQFNNTGLIDLDFDFQNEDMEIETGKSIEDALISSLNELGKVDIEYISLASGKSYEDVISKLDGVIYQNPMKWNMCYYQGFEMADEYLSGNVLKKYRLAKEAVKKYGDRFKKNVDALKERLPKSLDTDEIYITLGSPWIPSEIIDEYIFYLSGLRRNYWYGRNFQVRHDSYTGIWEIPNKGRFRNTSASIKDSETFGTKRMGMLHILEASLNMRTPRITDEAPNPLDRDKTIRVLNEKETMLAIEKQKLLIETFQKWVWQDTERAKKLKEIYLEKYNGMVKRKFDGSFLTFPTMSESVKLYDYQKDAVARIIFSPNTLLAHDVGSGKTYEMIAAGMEMKRLGISNKNLYVVPNNIVSQWEKIFKEMYPDSKLLIVIPSTFKPDKRNEVLRKIAEEDFDGILMSYSCFDMLPMSKSYYEKLYEEKKALLNEASVVFYSYSKLENKIKKLDKLLLELNKNDKMPKYDISFDELGITTMFVDEAHNYKNVPLDTNIKYSGSLSSSGSKKCELMMDRARCIQMQNGGRGIVFATGTPITNSVTDLFVMQKYLQNGELSLMGIQNFDSWIGMFAEKEDVYEIDVDTNSYHLVTRFSNFHNLPELGAILSSIADFHKAGTENGLPILNGYDDMVIKGDRFFINFLDEISQRADLVRKREVKKEKDNLLKITTDGRKGALDLRLLDEKKYKDVKSTKTIECCKNVYRIYKKTEEEKLTQVIFCDTSVPKKGFNVYDEVKNTLIEMGVEPNEIEFIHNASTDKEREKLFESIRRGDIRIIIGSTFKLGIGVNIQDKLVALHHLDIPWRPADMVQREGRILRQGNINKEIKIFRYITEGSFDAYSWQLLETKERFISQLLSCSIDERDNKNIDNTVLDYAEIKALAVGNPMVKRRCELINTLAKEKTLQHEYIENRIKYKEELSNLPIRVSELLNYIGQCSKDKEHYINSKKDIDKEEAKALRSKIYNKVNLNFENPEEVYITDYQGFTLKVPAYMTGREGKVLIEHNGRYFLNIESEKGILTRINNFLENFDDQIEKHRNKIKELKERRKALEEELKTDKSRVDIINALEKEIEILNKEMGLE